MDCGVSAAALFWGEMIPKALVAGLVGIRASSTAASAPKQPRGGSVAARCSTYEPGAMRNRSPLSLRGFNSAKVLEKSRWDSSRRTLWKRKCSTTEQANTTAARETSCGGARLGWEVPRWPDEVARRPRAARTPLEDSRHAGGEGPFKCQGPSRPG